MPSINNFLSGISLDQVRATARAPLTNLRLGRQAKHLSKSVKPWAMFDLDETLTYKRQGKTDALPTAFSRGENPTIRDWSPWQKHLRDDVPEPEQVANFHELSKTHNVGILTARSERARPTTEKWLKRNNLTPDMLMMRPLAKNMENMSSGPYKDAMMSKHLPKANVTHFFDDSPGVVAAMKERGIPSVTQVEPKELAPVLPRRRRESSARRAARRRDRTPGYIDDPRRTNPLM